MCVGTLNSMHKRVWHVCGHPKMHVHAGMAWHVCGHSAGGHPPRHPVTAARPPMLATAWVTGHSARAQACFGAAKQPGICARGGRQSRDLLTGGGTHQPQLRPAPGACAAESILVGAPSGPKMGGLWPTGGGSVSVTPESRAEKGWRNGRSWGPQGAESWKFQRRFRGRFEHGKRRKFPWGTLRLRVMLKCGSRPQARNARGTYFFWDPNPLFSQRFFP